MKKRIQLLLGATLIAFMGFGQAFGQVTYNGNGNTGFGGAIGGGNLKISDNGTTLTLTFTRGAGNLNDKVVMYIDSDNDVNITSTSGLTDTGDDLRKGISGFDGTNRSTITFPNGFEPDYALAFDTGFGGLWKIVSGGSHTFVTSANLDSTGSATLKDYVLDIDFSEIGMSADSTVKFIVTYISSTAFRANEAIGTPISGGNPGQAAVTFSGYGTYQAQVDISGTAGWRLLSLPKTGGTVADISDDTAVQGVSGGSDTGSDANVYTYDDTGSFEVPATVSTAIPDGNGLAVYFYNNTTNGSSTLPLTLDASGSEPTSDVVVNMYSGATGRYTLVGNPFAANVDLANVSANIAISPNVTFWDNAAGSYTSQSTSGGLVIKPWQGYWVQTANSTSGGQLTFGTSDKTSTAAGTTHFDKALPSSVEELKLSIKSSYNTEKNLTLQVADDASLEWDNYDLIKLGSLLPQNVSGAFIGKLDGKDVLKGVEAIPSSLDEQITIPILVDLTGESQTLTLDWEGLDKMPESWSFMLHDYETGISYDLESIENYEFDVIINESQEKVNPLSVINNSIGTPMRAKSGSTPRFGITIAPGTSVSIDDEIDAPTEFTLGQNYPNPFNPTTNINYSVGEAGPVNITVYNTMGQKVAELLNTTKSAGSYQLTWNATGVASGIYYYRLTAPGQVLTRQMTLIK